MSDLPSLAVRTDGWRSNIDEQKLSCKQVQEKAVTDPAFGVTVFEVLLAGGNEVAEFDYDALVSANLFTY